MGRRLAAPQLLCLWGMWHPRHNGADDGKLGALRSLWSSAIDISNRVRGGERSTLRGRARISLNDITSSPAPHFPVRGSGAAASACSSPFTSPTSQAAPATSITRSRSAVICARQRQRTGACLPLLYGTRRASGRRHHEIAVRSPWRYRHCALVCSSAKQASPARDIAASKYTGIRRLTCSRAKTGIGGETPIASCVWHSSVW